MRHLALFNGIGGFQLAADWCGWENVAHCEIDDFCNKVVARHFPHSKCYKDIKKFTGSEYRGTIDIISGGFPCQPFSVAGQQRGTADDRYFWDEMFRVITEVRPRWVVAENVGGFIIIDNGLVFEQTIFGLEGEGYEVQTYIIPACAVDAPHRRDRVWIVAYAADAGIKGLQKSKIGADGFGDATDADSVGRNGRGGKKCANSERQSGENEQERRDLGREAQRCGREFTQSTWDNFPTQSPICRGNDGISSRLDRIKALGNAIVPQVAFEIFKSIDKIERGNEMSQMR